MGAPPARRGRTGPDHPGPAAAWRAALRNRALLTLLGAFGAVNLAELAAVTALSIYAFRAGGTLAVGLIGFRLLPGALSSALLAPLLDRRPRVLTHIAQLRAALLALAAGAVLADVALGAVIVVVALDAVVAAPYRPAQALLVPRLARAPAEVSSAAAGISIVKSLGQALGALAGGIGAALLDPGPVVAAGAVVMLAAAVASGRLGDDRRPASFAAPRAGWRQALLPATVGLGEAAPFVIASGLRTLIRGMWSALLVVVALQLFGLGRAGVGVMNAAAGLGAVLALPVTASLIGRARLGGPCAVAFTGAGAALSVVGALHVGTVAVLVVCAWGVAMAVADATSLSLLARLLDASTLGRTVGVMESLKLAFEGLGALLAPGLVALFGVRSALIGAGALLPLTIVIGYPRMRRADLAAAGRGRVAALLHGVDVLHSLDMAALEEVAARARRVIAAPGTEIVTEGDTGDAFYAIESGSTEVVLGGFVIGRLGPGTGFGERALLRATPRSSTVRALESTALYAIDRVSFLSAVTGLPPGELAETGAALARPGPAPIARPLADVLADITFLHGISTPALAALAAEAVSQQWDPGEVIIREGDEATAFFVVLAGRAHATISGRVVGELHPGDGFGEIGVLHRTRRQATVAAAEPTSTCRVGADALRAAIAQRDANYAAD